MIGWSGVLRRVPMRYLVFVEAVKVLADVWLVGFHGDRNQSADFLFGFAPPGLVPTMRRASSFEIDRTARIASSAVRPFELMLVARFWVLVVFLVGLCGMIGLYHRRLLLARPIIRYRKELK
jgi:hypothetical protein